MAHVLRDLGAVFSLRSSLFYVDGLADAELKCGGTGQKGEVGAIDPCKEWVGTYAMAFNTVRLFFSQVACAPLRIFFIKVKVVVCLRVAEFRGGMSFAGRSIVRWILLGITGVKNISLNDGAFHIA